MTLPSLSAAMLLTTCWAFAQCNPQPPVITSTAGASGAPGHMFDVTNTSNVGVKVVALAQMLTLPGVSDFEIYTKPGSWAGFDRVPSAWTFVGSATGVPHLGAPNLTTIPITLDAPIPPGGTRAFYLGLTTVGSVACGHTDNVTGQAQVIGRDGTIEIWSGPVKIDTFGQSLGTPLTAGYIWNGSVTYCAGGSIDAANRKLGTGCIQSYDSFYQLFSCASLAELRLSGNSLRFVRTATGYRGVWMPGTAAINYRAPIAAQVLAVGSDGVAAFNLVGASFPTPQGPQTSLDVDANGIVTWGGLSTLPGTLAWIPTARALLDNDPAGVYAWHDYDPAEPGSGPVVAEQIGNVAYVTYNNVEAPSTPPTANRSTIQFQFDLITGDITLVFLRVDANSTATFGSRHIIGISGPGPSKDPGSVDLATAVLVAELAVDGLGLSATNRPVLGANWNLRVDAIPATAVLGVQILGVSDPGIDDLASLGMPGCGLRASLDIVRPFNVAGPSFNYSEVIPASMALNGVSVHAAAAVFINPRPNPFGAITSNGVRGRIGDF